MSTDRKQHLNDLSVMHVIEQTIVTVLFTYLKPDQILNLAASKVLLLNSNVYQYNLTATQLHCNLFLWVTDDAARLLVYLRKN